MISVKNKRILLIGSSGVLGSEFVKALYENKANLIMSDVNNLKFNKVIKKFPDIKYLFCNLSKESEIIKMVSKAVNFYNGIDGVIFNSAVTQESLVKKNTNNFPDFENYPLSLWKKSIDVNLTSAFLIARECSKHLKKSNGSLVFVSSIYGIVGPDHSIYENQKFKSIPAYSASKAGLIGLARWLSTWYAKKNVRVNVVVPGGVFNNHNNRFKNIYSKKTIMNRMAKPDDLSGIILYLMSDRSSYVTGQNFIIDGGFTAW